MTTLASPRICVGEDAALSRPRGDQTRKEVPCPSRLLFHPRSRCSLMPYSTREAPIPSVRMADPQPIHYHHACLLRVCYQEPADNCYARVVHPAVDGQLPTAQRGREGLCILDNTPVYEALSRHGAHSGSRLARSMLFLDMKTKFSSLLHPLSRSTSSR